MNEKAPCFASGIKDVSYKTEHLHQNTTCPAYIQQPLYSRATDLVEWLPHALPRRYTNKIATVLQQANITAAT